MSTASRRQQGSEVLRNMGADECGEVHPGGRRSKRECCNTAKFPLGTRPGSELIGAEEAERAWPQLVRCAVPYAWCPISEDEDKRENISGEEASSAPSGDPSSGPKPRPERGPRPWEASGSGRGAEAKTSVIQECIVKMRQSFGHMQPAEGDRLRACISPERSRTATPEGRWCCAQVRTGPGVMQGETWLKSNVADRASWSQADARLGRPRIVAQSSDEFSGCRRCTEEQAWGPNVAEPKSQAGKKLGVPRIITKGSDEVSECRRCIGETARRCGQALSGWHGAWWPSGRRAQPHLRVDRSTDAPERKGGSEVQDDKTPRRSNDADGPGRGVNDHQLRAGKSLGVPSIAKGVRGCSRGHRGTAGRPRVMTSSGGVGPGDVIINRSDSDEIKRAWDMTVGISTTILHVLQGIKSYAKAPWGINYNTCHEWPKLAFQTHPTPSGNTPHEISEYFSGGH
ncbi:hypothetical protein GGX14DRAFT_657899 [Mycena pura]|uniref:Uncharacterized protein n=1 Tax=Mycena pura TaxID=153505 RepID=A0AAD6YLZ5_9AGAR|nr:hypothetical protein GGX14DRAFT_657899 [Mycena pura]